MQKPTRTNLFKEEGNSYIPFLKKGIFVCGKTKKAAFTLAEVLITLAVIGIVAAMTIPTLIQSYKKQVATTKLKKFYSMMEQAIKLSEIDNGSVEYWSKSKQVLDDKGNSDILANANEAEKFFMQYLGPYMKYTSIEKAKSNESKESNDPYNDLPQELKVVLSDGTHIIMHNGDCIDFNFDINGDKKPNSYGNDIFLFILGFTNEQMKAYGCDGKHFCAFGGYLPVKTRESALDRCKQTPKSCPFLLFYDNFEFKDDYPYKL